MVFTGAPGIETYTNTDGLKVIERFFHLPLDYSKPEGEKIRVFARNLIPKDKAKKDEDEEKLPYFVYLQGRRCGPGFEVPLKRNSGIVSAIHDQGYQTLWLDQRGTGLSTPLSAEVLNTRFNDQEIAEYLKHFRADNIVRDCEAIRNILLGHKSDPEDQKWTIMGQSFGGFCAITYLSFYSEGLKEVFLTGGLAPLIDHPDLAYRSLIPRVVKRNLVYYEKYPQDVKRVRAILAHLDTHAVTVPNGGNLTPRRWLHLGLEFGGHGGIERIHQLVLRAYNDLELFGRLSYKLLQSVEAAQAFDGNPIYAILHEPLYCQGLAPKWSAARMLKDFPQFSWDHVKTLENTEPVFFTGEMIFPDMFDDYINLRPLKVAAEILANDKGWGPLYDIDQLAKNEVKVNSATYMEDMYVDFNLAQDTAGKIKGIEQYITNQLFHNAIQTEPGDVMKHLFQLSKRRYD
ncbi:alpha/beta-hydrolase [Ramaria rubella]|nr:alpha/beta-hydrolase [Ramaria rubella]